MATTPPRAPIDGSIPDWLKDELEHQKGLSSREYEVALPNDGKKLELWDQEYPELKMRFNLSGNWGDSIPFRAAFQKFQDNVTVYDNTVKELAANYGVEFQRNHDALVITQRDYNLKYIHSMTGSGNPVELLGRVEDDARQIWTERDDKFKALLTKKGVAIEKSPPSDDSGISIATISHFDLPAHSISVTLYGESERIDRKGLRTIEAALADIGKAIGTQPEAKARPKTATPVVRVKSYEKPVLPDEQKVTPIFDANILDRDSLGAPRGAGERTWLDLLPFTAKLPTVDKILITAHIADWELMGRVTRNTGGSSYEYVPINRKAQDPNDRYSQKIQAASKLLATASRWHIDNEGKGHFIEGRNPDIVIYESPQDREFANEILRIHDSPKLHYSDKQREYSRKRVELRDVGELVMQNTAMLLEAKTPVYLISDDINFVRSDRRNTRLTTKHGQPIGHATLHGYVDAEMFARGEQLKKEFEREFGLPMGEFSTERVKRDIMTARGNPEGVYPQGHRPCTPGIIMKDGESVQGELLASIFKRGADIQYGKAVPAAPTPKERHDLQEAAQGAGGSIFVDTKNLLLDGKNLADVVGPGERLGPAMAKTTWAARETKPETSKSASIRQLRWAMNALFNPPGGQDLTLAAISKATGENGVSRKDVGDIMGIGNDSVPNLNRLHDNGEKLARALAELPGGAEKVESFKELFRQFEEKARQAAVEKAASKAQR